jgi:hypothetical protein
VENPYWKEFFKKLNPGFKPPTPYQMAGKFRSEEQEAV